MNLPFDSRNIRYFLERNKLLEWGSFILLSLLILGPLSFLAWLVFFTSTFNVQAITIVDAREHTSEQVRELSQILIGKNILFAQTPVLEQKILSSVPQLRDVHIVRKLPGTIKIIAQEKNPALLLLNNGTYYFVDDRGIAYEEARLDTLPGTVLPIIKNNDQSGSFDLGTPVVEQAFVQFVLQGQKDVPGVTGAQVAEIRMPSLAAREVHFQLDNNWLIKFDITRPLSSQLDVLQRLLAHTISEEDRPRIEYIDLRIPSRVYYKLRGVSVPE